MRPRGLLPEQIRVERGDEARVDDAGFEPGLGNLLRRALRQGQHVAQGPDLDGVAFRYDFRLPEFNHGRFRRHGLPWPAAARVTDHGRLFPGGGGGNHSRELRLILGLHHNQPGHGPEEGDVKEAVVGGAVVAYDAGAVQAEYDRQVLQTDVVDHVIHYALGKGGIHRDHRQERPGGHAGGENNRVLLGDADVEEAVGEAPGEIGQPGAHGHGRGDGDDSVVALRQAFHGLAEHVRIFQRARGLQLAPGLAFKRAGAVPDVRLGLGEGVAPAFLGGDVDEDGLIGVFGDLERRKQRGQAVPVDRADVAQAELLEENAAQEEALDGLLHPQVGAAQPAHVELFARKPLDV